MVTSAVPTTATWAVRKTARSGPGRWPRWRRRLRRCRPAGWPCAGHKDRRHRPGARRGRPRRPAPVLDEGQRPGSSTARRRSASDRKGGADRSDAKGEAVGLTGTEANKVPGPQDGVRRGVGIEQPHARPADHAASLRVMSGGRCRRSRRPGRPTRRPRPGAGWAASGPRPGPGGARPDRRNPGRSRRRRPGGRVPVSRSTTRTATGGPAGDIVEIGPVEGDRDLDALAAGPARGGAAARGQRLAQGGDVGERWGRPRPSPTGSPRSRPRCRADRRH